MVESLGLVTKFIRSVFSNAEILINVATSVIEYGLLGSAFMRATTRQVMTATHKCVRTAFSE